jgi:hypothetical protein
MKLVTYQKSKTQRLGIFYNEFIYDIQTTAKKLKLDLPSTMKEFLEGEKKAMKLAKKVYDAIKNKKIKSRVKLNDVTLLAPVTDPPLNERCLCIPAACSNRTQKQRSRDDT